MEQSRQAEVIKRYQLSVAQNMGIKNEMLEVLGKQEVTEWIKREWLYICALDGMDVKTLHEMLSEEVNIEIIKEKREAFWHQKLQQSDEILREFETLRTEIEEAKRESQEVREDFSKKLKNSQSSLKELQTEVEGKNKLLKQLEDQKAELEEKIEQLIMEREREDALEKEVPGKGEETFIKKVLHKISACIGKRRQIMDTQRFVQKFLEDSSYTNDQIEFILECREEGMSVNDIEKIAVPGASVEVMKRLKEIVKRKEKKDA